MSGSGGRSDRSSSGDSSSTSDDSSNNISDGGTDEGSSGGSTDGRSSVDSMNATTGAINDNRGYNASGEYLGGDNPGNSSGNSLVDKKKNSASSVDDKNISDNSNKKMTKTGSSYKFWLFIITLVLGTLLFCLSKKNNESTDDSRDVKTIDLAPKN